jgi:DNA-binding response OmpR family regulator
LEGEGFAVDVVGDGTEALWLASEQPYDALVLDIMLPGMNGYQVCSALRERGNWTPILMLTAKDGEYDEAEALDTGADDFVSKPFSYVVLLARLRALVRRGAAERPAVLTVGDLRLDPADRSCQRSGESVRLSPREFAVLEYLMRRAGQVVSKAELLAHVWDFGFAGDANIVEVYVGYLRRKLDVPFGRHTIETVRGAGYRLVEEG